MNLSGNIWGAYKPLRVEPSKDESLNPKLYVQYIKGNGSSSSYVLLASSR